LFDLFEVNNERYNFLESMVFVLIYIGITNVKTPPTTFKIHPHRLIVSAIDR